MHSQSPFLLMNISLTHCLWCLPIYAVWNEVMRCVCFWSFIYRRMMMTLASCWQIRSIHISQMVKSNLSSVFLIIILILNLLTWRAVMSLTTGMVHLFSGPLILVVCWAAFLVSLDLFPLSLNLIQTFFLGLFGQTVLERYARLHCLSGSNQTVQYVLHTLARPPTKWVAPCWYRKTIFSPPCLSRLHTAWPCNISSRK